MIEAIIFNGVAFFLIWLDSKSFILKPKGNSTFLKCFQFQGFKLYALRFLLLASSFPLSVRFFTSHILLLPT